MAVMSCMKMMSPFEHIENLLRRDDNGAVSDITFGTVSVIRLVRKLSRGLEWHDGGGRITFGPTELCGRLSKNMEKNL